LCASIRAARFGDRQGRIRSLADNATGRSGHCLGHSHQADPRSHKGRNNDRFIAK
jgi:hypothetical protein